MSEQESGQQPDQPEQQPVLRVVSSHATPEEVAALVAVFAALGDGGEESRRRPVSHWAAPSRRLRRPLHAGRGAWVASARP